MAYPSLIKSYSRIALIDDDIVELPRHKRMKTRTSSVSPTRKKSSEYSEGSLKRTKTGEISEIIEESQSNDSHDYETPIKPIVKEQEIPQ